MPVGGIPQLLPGSVLMRNEHGQLIVVQQGHTQLNGSMLRQVSSLIYCNSNQFKVVIKLSM